MNLRTEEINSINHIRKLILSWVKLLDRAKLSALELSVRLF